MNYDSEDLLSMVELYATKMGFISSEDELSEAFDENIAPDVVKSYGEDDKPAMNEAFNNWTDMLCQGGEIHPIQYEQYCYVGKHS